MRIHFLNGESGSRISLWNFSNIRIYFHTMCMDTRRYSILIWIHDCHWDCDVCMYGLFFLLSIVLITYYDLLLFFFSIYRGELTMSTLHKMFFFLYKRNWKTIKRNGKLIIRKLTEWMNTFVKMKQKRNKKSLHFKYKICFSEFCTQ